MSNPPPGNGTITAANVAVSPNAFTPGSAIATPNQGPGVLEIQIDQASGSFSIEVASSLTGQSWYVLDISSLFNWNSGAPGAATVPGIYQIAVPGPAYVVATAFSGANINIQTNFIPGIGGGGGSGGGPASFVSILANALGTERTGQVVIATTGVAVQGPNLAAVNGVIVKAGNSNTSIASTSGSIGGGVGGASVTDVTDGTGNSYALDPGTSLGFAVANANQLYVNGKVGDVFYFGVS